MSTDPIDLICVDIDGTITRGVLGETIAGARSALESIRRRWPVRLVTNTTSVPLATLAADLRDRGLLDDPSALVTPAVAARQVLEARGHTRGLLLADAAARPELDWFHEAPDGDVVLLATEAHELRIRDLQPAFRRLLEGASLYTMQRNRYFSRAGELLTDLGPVAAFLEYASGVQAQTLGKPSALLFDALARQAGTTRSALVMVGDDAEFDVAASVEIGMRGVLVRTGKYRPGDEQRVSPAPTAVLESIAELPAWLGIA